jgi:deaminated glutathione amidase
MNKPLISESHIPAYKAAAIQTVSGEDVQDNVDKTAFWVAEAAKAGAQLVVLPEYFILMSPHEEAKRAIAEPFGRGPIQTALSTMAAQHSVWLVAGSLPLHGIDDPQKVRNTCLVFDPSGACVARYDKIHLFRFSRGAETHDETRTIEPGDHPVSITTPFGRLGLAICYDLRFPELFRALGRPDIIVLPAAFTHTTGQAHWEILLKARAIENLCPLIAANQGGHHPSGRRTFGHSLILDEWGTVLACHQEGWGMALSLIDPETTALRRTQLPALEHRLLGL